MGNSRIQLIDSVRFILYIAVLEAWQMARTPNSNITHIERTIYIIDPHIRKLYMMSWNVYHLLLFTGKRLGKGHTTSIKVTILKNIFQLLATKTIRLIAKFLFLSMRTLWRSFCRRCDFGLFVNRPALQKGRLQFFVRGRIRRAETVDPKHKFFRSR